MQARSKMAANKKKEPCSEEARTRILDAAQTLFAARGFNATTTKAIAEAAEVPGGLIFYYFPSKKALLASVLSERNILVELRSAGDTLQVPDLRTALLTLGSRYLDALRHHQELTAILLREFRSHHEIADQFHELREEHVRLITSHIQEALRGKQAASVQHIQAMARTFFYNLIVIGLIEDSPEPLRFIEEMVDVLLGGIWLPDRAYT
jgi:AcrR family transcriptional regulator